MTFPAELYIALSSLVAIGCALLMLFTRRTIFCAMGLLGVLVSTSFIYGMLSEHFIAAIQLVIYAGAIMVFFIFSIMLLNFKEQSTVFVTFKAPFLWLNILIVIVIFALIGKGLYFGLQQISHSGEGPFSQKAILEMGGNTFVLSERLFTTHVLFFEMISIILLVAIVSAIVLAKRKSD